MHFVLLHTADWQLGKPFGRFEPDKAAILRRAREEAIDRLASAARAAGAAHILVAGDVFDGESVPDVLVRQTLRRMASAPDLQWHLLPGNHDPARPGGVWERVQSAQVPGNVHLRLASGVTEIVPGVQLLVAPLHAKAATSDPTRFMNDVATPDGHLRIGMAHGSVQGFGSLGEAPVPIDPSRAVEAGLAYLALGDWHGVKEISRATWYSGTPEPDSFAGNEPGHALVVRLESGAAPPIVERVKTGVFQWESRSVAIDRAGELERLVEVVAGMPAAINSWLLALTLTGRVGAAALPVIERQTSLLAEGLFHLRLDRQGMKVHTTGDDVAQLSEGVARAVAARLQTRLEESPEGSREARRTALALSLLFALDAETGEARP